MAKPPRDERFFRYRTYKLMSWCWLFGGLTLALMYLAVFIGRKPERKFIPVTPATPEAESDFVPPLEEISRERIPDPVAYVKKLREAMPDTPEWKLPTKTRRPERTIEATPGNPFLHMAATWDADCHPRLWLLQSGSMTSASLRDFEEDPAVLELPDALAVDGDFAVVRTSLGTEAVVYATGSPPRIMARDGRNGELLWEGTFPDRLIPLEDDTAVRLDAFVAFGEPWVAAFRRQEPGLYLYHAETGVRHYTDERELVLLVSPGEADEQIYVSGVHRSFILDHQFLPHTRNIHSSLDRELPSRDRVVYPWLLDQFTRREEWDWARIQMIRILNNTRHHAIESAVLADGTSLADALDRLRVDWVHLLESRLSKLGWLTNRVPFRARLGSHELYVKADGRMTLELFSWSSKDSRNYASGLLALTAHRSIPRKTHSGRARLPFCAEPTQEELSTFFTMEHHQRRPGDPMPQTPPPAENPDGTWLFSVPPWSEGRSSAAAIYAIRDEDSTAMLTVRAPWRDVQSLANMRSVWLAVLAEDGSAVDLHEIIALTKEHSAEDAP